MHLQQWGEKKQKQANKNVLKRKINQKAYVAFPEILERFSWRKKHWYWFKVLLQPLISCFSVMAIQDEHKYICGSISLP